MRPSSSLAPQKAPCQNHAQKFPISSSVLKLAAQTGLHLSGRCPYGSQSHHPLAAALSSSILGMLFSASTYWFRETYAVLYWITVQSREAHVPMEWLLHTSFREAEVLPLTSDHIASLYGGPPFLHPFRSLSLHFIHPFSLHGLFFFLFQPTLILNA